MILDESEDLYLDTLSENLDHSPAERAVWGNSFEGPSRDFLSSSLRSQLRQACRRQGGRHDRYEAHRDGQ